MEKLPSLFAASAFRFDIAICPPALTSRSPCVAAMRADKSCGFKFRRESADFRRARALGGDAAGFCMSAARRCLSRLPHGAIVGTDLGSAHGAIRRDGEAMLRWRCRRFFLSTSAAAWGCHDRPGPTGALVVRWMNAVQLAKYWITVCFQETGSTVNGRRAARHRNPRRCTDPSRETMRSSPSAIAASALLHHA